MGLEEERRSQRGSPRTALPLSYLSIDFEVFALFANAFRNRKVRPVCWVPALLHADSSTSRIRKSHIHNQKLERALPSALPGRDERTRRFS